MVRFQGLDLAFENINFLFQSIDLLMKLYFILLTLSDYGLNHVSELLFLSNQLILKTC